jgi:hypothetical protein
VRARLEAAHEQRQVEMTAQMHAMTDQMQAAVAAQTAQMQHLQLLLNNERALRLDAAHQQQPICPPGYGCGCCCM